MFIADYEILETSNPSVFTIKDKSSGDAILDVVTTRTITLYKTDLVPMVFNFPVGESAINVAGNLQDFVFVGVYSVGTQNTTEDSVYTKTHEFVTLGYTKKAKYDRIVELEINEKIVDKRQFKIDTNEINYHMESAITLAQNSNLVDAQKNLDYIKLLTGYNSIK